MTTPNHTTPPAPRRDLVIAFLCGGLVADMVGLSFAAVPFYSWFCRATGYGGTTQVATTRPTQISNLPLTVGFDSHAAAGPPPAPPPTPTHIPQRTTAVRFDSNVAAGLPWRFEPERRTIEVKLGEVV